MFCYSKLFDLVLYKKTDLNRFPLFIYTKISFIKRANAGIFLVQRFHETFDQVK